jgi:hypothetical protein
MMSSVRRALYAFPCEDVPWFYSQFVLCAQSIATDFKSLLEVAVLQSGHCLQPNWEHKMLLREIRNEFMG